MITAALGDSQNDLPMLKAVDYPILIRKPDGNDDDTVKLNNLIRTDEIGPLGWNNATLKLLEKLS